MEGRGTQGHTCMRRPDNTLRVYQVPFLGAGMLWARIVGLHSGAYLVLNQVCFSGDTNIMVPSTECLYTLTACSCWIRLNQARPDQAPLHEAYAVWCLRTREGYRSGAL